MGKYAEDEWYQREVHEYLHQYGEVPPPWVFAVDAHPYSMQWRMGSGETHCMVLHEWLNQRGFDFDERISYVRRYPVPPRWYMWVVSFIWKRYPPLSEAEQEEYFTKLTKLGFSDVDQYEEDLDREDFD